MTKILPFLTARYTILCTRRLQPPCDDYPFEYSFSSVSLLCLIDEIFTFLNSAVWQFKSQPISIYSPYFSVNYFDGISRSLADGSFTKNFFYCGTAFSKGKVDRNIYTSYGTFMAIVSLKKVFIGLSTIFLKNGP